MILSSLSLALQGKSLYFYYERNKPLERPLRYSPTFGWYDVRRVPEGTKGLFISNGWAIEYKNRKTLMSVPFFQE